MSLKTLFLRDIQLPKQFLFLKEPLIMADIPGLDLDSSSSSS